MRERLYALILAAMVYGCAAMPATVPSPLIGTWRQDRTECGDAAPVAELIFRADGQFSVTWFPFETYKDYWGAWRYDEATRLLALSIDGGNYIPQDFAPSAVINVDAHQLSLGAISLGAPPNHEVARCTAPFRH